MYRPEGWKNPHIPMQKEPFISLADEHFRHLADCKHIAYEAGADAMLEAIKCIGLNFTCYPFRMGSMDVFDYEQSLEGKNGWLVFIPEEQE